MNDPNKTLGVNKSAALASAASGSSQSKELKTPVEWVKILKIKPYYLSGVMMFAGWSDKQKITESEFKRKLDEWLRRPIGSHRRVK